MVIATNPGHSGALAGLSIIELATQVSGPYCGKLLAGLGARVLKVEPPGGDPCRREGPFPSDTPDEERSGLFLHLNTGKQSMVLDLAQQTQRDRLFALLAGADVLTVNLRPEYLEQLRLQPDRLLDQFPQLVIVSLTTFGLTGPYANYRGGELIAYAAGGYLTLTGAADREPIKSYGSLVEYEAGAHAALGTLAALAARERTGRGQLVDVAAMEASTFMLGAVEQSAYFYGTVTKRNGTRLLGFAPQHSYPSTIRPCRDGYVHCHSNNRYLDLLGALIPHPRLLDPELLATMMGHADEIDAIMDAWLADKDRRTVVQQAQQFRLPFTEVMEPGEVMSDAHHRERGSFVTVDQPAAGAVLQPGAPMRLHGTPWRTLPAPLLGRHDGDWPASDEQPALRPNAAAPAHGRRSVKPLDGVRVIDFTNAVAGPIASFILGDLGAEVIKIEAPGGRPLHAAGTAPLQPGAPDLSYNRVMIFNELNHGKRGISLDVATPAGHQLFLELVATADVMVENFAPRVLGNLGIDYPRLSAVRPDLILVSMPAFGLSGPYRDRIAYGPGIDAMSGLSHLTGYADGPPMKPGNFFCDQNAGVHAAFATLAALRHRQRTGAGQHVELAMIEGEFQIIGDAYIDFAMNGRERRRSGNDHPWMAPHGVFPCVGDGTWLAVAVENNAQWQALCRVIGRPELAEDPRFATVAARHSHREELSPIISAWTSTREHYAAQNLLQAAGVPAAAVLNAVELLRDPHVQARHGFEYVNVAGVGPTPYPRVAFTLSATPVPISKPAPAFGEDNSYVYTELLGLPAQLLRTLASANVVTTAPLAT